MGGARVREGPVVVRRGTCAAGVGAALLALNELWKPKADRFNAPTLRLILLLASPWAGWVLWRLRSRSMGVAACLFWISTFLFTPFLVAALLCRSYGASAAAALWLLLGVAAPPLHESAAMRQIIRHIKAWPAEYSILGAIENTKSKHVLYCHHPHGKMMELMGCVSAKAATLKETLRRGDADVAIVPGGVEEVVLASPERERSFVLHRKGFVKYALQFGYDLVPVYHFGETQLYTVLWPFDAEWVVRLRLAATHLLQLPSIFCVGWAHLPFLPDPDVACRTVVGERIELPHLPQVDREAVLRWHAEYVVQLKALYDKHRQQMPAYRDKELELW